MFATDLWFLYVIAGSTAGVIVACAVAVVAERRCAAAADSSTSWRWQRVADTSWWCSAVLSAAILVVGLALLR